MSPRRTPRAAAGRPGAPAMPCPPSPAVAARHVRFVFSAEPLERLHTLPERVADTKLAAATTA